MTSHSNTCELEGSASEVETTDLEKKRKVLKGSAGFSLIEVVIALVILMIALLGVVAVFGYTIVYNAGNKSRAQALTVLQQEVERYRAAKFNAGSPPDNYTPGDPDDGRRDITGGVKPQRVVTAENGYIFLVDVTVDDDPFAPNTSGPQEEDTGYECTTPQGDVVDCTIKEITINVTLAAPSPGWQVAVPATIVLRRVRGN
jgi:type II secretory pathway pseudopilin PulG